MYAYLRINVYWRYQGRWRGDEEEFQTCCSKIIPMRSLVKEVQNKQLFKGSITGCYCSFQSPLERLRSSTVTSPRLIYSTKPLERPVYIHSPPEMGPPDDTVCMVVK